MSNLDKVQALFAAYARAQRRYRHTGRDGGLTSYGEFPGTILWPGRSMASRR
jgi:hypothetical protein